MTNYRAVAITERLPKIANDNYIIISEKGIEKIRFFNGTRFESDPHESEITHWLEKVTDNNDISDGYHTFRELYDFRKVYNAALFNVWFTMGYYNVHKSFRHYDGELCFGGGWFIVVAVLPTGQISNHYELKDWDLFNIPAKDKALFPFDGHNSADVLERLKSV